MAYILDTHVLIYFGEGHDSLSEEVKSAIEARKELYVSIASLWEISIKNSLGKLPLAGAFDEIPQFLRLNSMKILKVEFQDLVINHKLPQIHRDPFDRILIAQAKRTGYTLITRDQKIRKYDIKTLW